MLNQSRPESQENLNFIELLTKKGTIKEIIKPNLFQILIWFAFLFLAFAGLTQAWAFSDGEEFGMPKPLFYDLFRPFPFWLLWVFTLIPLAIPSILLVMIGGYNSDFILHAPRWVFLIILLVYYYVISGIIGFIFKFVNEDRIRMNLYKKEMMKKDPPRNRRFSE